MASEWYYAINGQQAATPVSSAHLKQLAATGQLQPTDLVWQEGMPNWMPASAVKGLFATPRQSGSEAAAVERTPDDRPSLRRADRVAAPAGAGLLGLHPVLVALLSLCSGGIFGLVYTYVVCARFAAEANRRSADAAGRPLGRARHPLAVLLLAHLTFGLYLCWWVVKVIEECNAYLGRKDSAARTDLALMLIFPPYAAYLSVARLPGLIRAAAEQAKQPEAEPAGHHLYLFLIPCLLPALPFLSMVQQDQLNRIWGSAP
jgi:hypothetical protein